MGANQRRYERFAVNLKATLVRGKTVVKGRVVDVSFTGLFFTTARPPPLRDLVKIDMALPDGDVIHLLGMAVHLVRPNPADKRRPGVGVQLFGIGPDVRAAWDEFVTGVRKAHLKAADEGGLPDKARTGDLAARDETSDGDEPQDRAPIVEEVPPERLPTSSLFALPTSDDVEAALDRLEMPTDTPSSGNELRVSFDDEPGPGDMAPPAQDPHLETARPELRVKVGSVQELEPLRARQEAGEPLFFRTEVHMSVGTIVQVRIVTPDDATAAVVDGRVVESVRNADAKGLSIVLDKEDVAPSEDIYITIDLDSDWLQSST